jgi:hypothetical protein
VLLYLLPKSCGIYVTRLLKVLGNVVMLAELFQIEPDKLG